MGCHPVRLQAGGRITLPEEWREELADRRTLLVLMSSSRLCILLVPADTLCEYDTEAARRLGLPIRRRAIDERGRVRLPRDLIDAAGLKTELTAVGVLIGIEIWDRKAFYDITPSSAVLSAAAAEIGF